jgi:tetratricopeptide (TPR) repeat protein
MPARDLPEEKLTPADDLREWLRQCEIKVVALRGNDAEAVNFLHLMDQAQSLFHHLEERGVDLRAERTRWRTIEQQLRSRAASLVKATRTVGGLVQLRETTNPTPDRWWWFLDRELHRRRQQTLKRMAVGGLAALLILAIASLLYQRFLAPDPVTQQATRLSLQAERAIDEGHLEGALTQYEALRDLTPNDPEVFVRLGAIYETMGRVSEAAQAYERAQELLPSKEDFFIERGIVHLQLSQWEAAQSDAEAALALNPELTLAYWILGGVYEAHGQIQEATSALQQAADLAFAQGNDPLYAMIKIRMGILMGGGSGTGP